MIKRFNEVIQIISNTGQSNDALNKVQYLANDVIHNNLYNFMLPNKVKEVIDRLTPIFISMKELKGLPPKVDEKRNTLLAQGRVIVNTLRGYVNVKYTQEEYNEVYDKMCKRALAQYLKAKPTLTMTDAVTMLSDAKQLLKEWQVTCDKNTTGTAFQNMIDELKTFITDSI